MSLSVDNLIGVQPTLTSSSQLKGSLLDIYNGTTNFHRLTSSASAPLQTITIPNASGTMTLNTATQTITNKMNHAQLGSATDPSYSWVGNTTMGMYRFGINTIGFATNSVVRVTISDASMDSAVPIKCDNYKAFNSGGSGNVIYGDLNSTTGMYFDVNRINFSTNSVARLGITTSQILPSLVIKTIDGSSADVAYGFVNQPAGTGFTCNAVNRLAMCVSSTAYTQWTGGYVDNVVQLRSQQGTAAVPSIVCRLAGQETTGIYWSATPTLNVAVSGSQAVGFESGGLKLYGSTAGNNALYSASLLGYYEQIDHSTTFTGGNAITTSIACKITRIGNLVTFYMPTWATSYTNTNGSTIGYASNTAIPVRFQPPTFIANVSIAYLGPSPSRVGALAYINAGTGIVVLEQTTGGIPNNTSWQMYGFSLTWTL